MPLIDPIARGKSGRFRTIGIDFETYYNTKLKYSLRNMTAEEYINSHLFQIIMVSIKLDGGKTYHVDGRDFDALAAHLRSLPWEDAAVYAFNGSFFDFLILAWVFGIKNIGFYLDPLLMARPFAGIGQNNTLAALSERHGVGKKLDTIYEMDGIRREDMSDEQFARYAVYCDQDTDLCYGLVPIFMTAWRVYDLAWMDMTMRMMSDPRFILDRDVIAKGKEGEIVKEGKQIERVAALMAERGIEISPEAMKKVRKLPVEDQPAGAVKKMLGSNTDFSMLLEAFGFEVPQKWSAKKKAWAPAFARTDVDFIAIQEDGGDEGAALVEGRLGVKSTIMYSRLDRLDGIARRMEYLPIPIMPFAAHTGRNGGSQKVNVQNFSSRPSASNPLGKSNPCRVAIKAQPGEIMIDADLSQIEVRVLGGVTGEPNILVPFGDRKNCPYCAAGPAILGQKVVKGVHKFERNLLKSAILGNGYGQGGVGFHAYCGRSGLKITEAKAQEVVSAYRRANPLVVDFWDACEWALQRIMDGQRGSFGHNGCLRVIDGGILLPSGRPLRYRGLQFAYRPDRRTGRMKKMRLFYDPVKHTFREVYGSLTCENIVQGIAADVVHEMGVDLAWRYNIWARLQVHDSLVFAEPERRLDYVVKQTTKVMCQPRPWMDWIPLDCEVEAGPDYGSTKLIEVDDVTRANWERETLQFHSHQYF